jgi:hypothetical protein
VVVIKEGCRERVADCALVTGWKTRRDETYNHQQLDIDKFASGSE